jgi:hypothetical protein
MFNAYIHCKPDGTPFYVGKGLGSRWKVLAPSWRSNYHAKVVKKYGAESILKSKFDCSSEEIAFELERGLIKCFKREGINLVNFTNGGQGMSGHSPSLETRKKLSNALKGKPKSEQAKIRVGLSNKGKKRSEAHKLAVSMAQRGRKSSDETKAKISISLKGKKKTLQGRLRIAYAIANQAKVLCNYCGKTGALRAMKRWHFDRCKAKPQVPKPEEVTAQ